MNCLSFKDAFIKNQRIITPPFSQKSSWFGKKIKLFFGYSDKKGWQIYQLGFFGQLFRKLNLFYRDTKREFIIQKLNDLTPEDANVIPKLIVHVSNKILQAQLFQIYKQKAHTQLQIYCSTKNQSNTWLSSPHEPRTITTRGDVQKNEVKIQIVATTPEVQVGEFIPPVTVPLSLQNYWNRCYLDSVLEVMLSQDSIREKIFQAYSQANISLQKENETILKKNILSSLKDLILLSAEINKQGKGFKTFSGRNSPAECIRKAIFTSQLNSDFNHQSNLYTQQDAASVLLLINRLLDNRFEIMEEDQALNTNFVVERPQSTDYKLVLRVQKDQNNELVHLINQFFSPQQASGTRKFSLGDGGKVYLPYMTRAKLVHLPDILSLHIGRFAKDKNLNTGCKLNEPVILPPNGVIDLTSYYFGREKENYHYEITGYVVHHGNQLTSGHYTANVKIGNRYYECNNLNPKSPFYREIPEFEFYGNQQAYLVMLKRIPVSQSQSRAVI